MSLSHQLPKDSPRLYTRICTPDELSRSDRNAMYHLLDRYFLNVDAELFQRDLDEKDSVVLLVDETQERLLGFTTLLKIETVVGDERIVAFYSGDTIADTEAWGSVHLHRAWAQHVWQLYQQITNARVYWFLVSCGYRTYRFMPVFFRDFVPNCAEQAAPEAQCHLEALATFKFPQEFNPAQGVVQFNHAMPVRPGVSDITPQRLHDPHIDFYVSRNPGYLQGQGLACLAEVCEGNLTAAARRLLRQ